VLHEDVKKLRRKHVGICLQLQWTPGHEGIEGNEKADQETKEAAENGVGNQLKSLPPLLQKPLSRSKSACKQAYMEKLKQKVAKLWMKSP